MDRLRSGHFIGKFSRAGHSTSGRKAWANTHYGECCRDSRIISTKITDYPVEEYDKVYAVNLRGSFLMTKYAVKAMEKYNYGRILLLASIAGKEGNPFMTGYSSMKAGVTGLVKGIGKEYAQRV